MLETSPEPPASSTQASRNRAKLTDSLASTSSEIGSAKTSGRKVHVVLSPKGGVGKSFISSLIAQALMERNAPVICFDTDRENASLVDIRALQARPVSLFLPNSEEIDINAMDRMIEDILTTDANVVMDNGATSFAASSRYMVDGDIPSVVAEAGKQMTIHVIVAGGQELEQTVRGFASIASQFPEGANLVLWLNEHHGPVDAGDVGFETTPVFHKFRHRITALIRLRRLNQSTFGANLADMLARGLTFAEADQSPDFFVVAKQRLRQIKGPIFEQISAVL